jgi:hypothetical protein
MSRPGVEDLPTSDELVRPAVSAPAHIWRTPGPGDLGLARDPGRPYVVDSWLAPVDGGPLWTYYPLDGLMNGGDCIASRCPTTGALCLVACSTASTNFPVHRRRIEQWRTHVAAHHRAAPIGRRFRPRRQGGSGTVALIESGTSAIERQPTMLVDSQNDRMSREVLLGLARALIGKVHLLPLPGSPRWGGQRGRRRARSATAASTPAWSRTSATRPSVPGASLPRVSPRWRSRGLGELVATAVDMLVDENGLQARSCNVYLL